MQDHAGEIPTPASANAHGHLRVRPVEQDVVGDPLRNTLRSASKFLIEARPDNMTFSRPGAA